MDEMERRYESETLALPPLSMTLVQVDGEGEEAEEAFFPRVPDPTVSEDVILKLIEFLLQEP